MKFDSEVKQRERLASKPLLISKSYENCMLASYRDSQSLNSDGDDSHAEVAKHSLYHSDDKNQLLSLEDFRHDMQIQPHTFKPPKKQLRNTMYSEHQQRKMRRRV